MNFFSRQNILNCNSRGRRKKLPSCFKMCFILLKRITERNVEKEFKAERKIPMWNVKKKRKKGSINWQETRCMQTQCQPSQRKICSFHCTHRNIHTVHISKKKRNEKKKKSATKMTNSLYTHLLGYYKETNWPSHWKKGQ